MYTFVEVYPLKISCALQNSWGERLANDASLCHYGGAAYPLLDV